jgi:tetratricopeptide (TPR) repeat protein
VAYGSLLGAARRRLHQRVANALIAAEPARRDELAPLLATHFQAAEDALETGRWQLRAGTQAFRINYGESKRRLRLAIDHLDAAPETAETLELRVRARTVLLRAGARTGMDTAEADAIVAAARPAADLVGDPALLGDLAVADGSVRFFGGDPARAQTCWIGAVQHAEAAGDAGLQAWACVITALTHVYTGPLPAGLVYVERGIRACGDDPTTHVAKAGYSVYDFGHWVHGYLCLCAGQLDRARELLRTAVALYDLRPVADWRSWTLALFAHLADLTGEATDAEEAGRVMDEALILAADSGSISAQVTALQGAGVAALLARRPGAALDNFTAALEMARKHGSGRLDEPTLLANLARAQLALGRAEEARAAAEEAVAVAQRQRTAVAEVVAHLARARVWRATATGCGDHDVDRYAASTGEAVARGVGASTQLAFLVEERARLDTDPDNRTKLLREAAEAFAGIGATGHARRLRAELDAGG